MAIREQNQSQDPARRKDPMINTPDEDEDEIDVEAPGETGDQRQGQQDPGKSPDGNVEPLEDEDADDDEGDEVDEDEGNDTPKL